MRIDLALLFTWREVAAFKNSTNTNLLIMDEVFGEQNFRNEIIIPGRAAKNLQRQFKTVARLNVRHDTLLWYSKSSAALFSPLWVEKHNAGNRPSEAGPRRSLTSWSAFLNC